jgi:Ca2+-binding EF-hand superfamily protein
LNIFRHILPGVEAGKFSFQEVLTIYRDISSGSSAEISRVSGGTSESFVKREPESLRLPERLRNTDHMETKYLSSSITTPSGGGKSTSNWHPTEKEFRTLDIRGEGKLNYLSLKSSLEIRGDSYPDDEIRQWIRSNDRGNKGYIDLNDFMAAKSFVGVTSQPPKSSGLNLSKSHGHLRERDKEAVLRRAFDRYDVDRDGLISVQDLRAAFQAQGKPLGDRELFDWVKKRDSKGGGAVDFDDFCKNY